MSKKVLLMGVSGALVVAALAGGSLAYFQATGSQVQQQINTQTLGIEFDQGEQDAVIRTEEDGKTRLSITTDKDFVAMPGKKYKKEVRVKNTAEVTLYAKVVIDKYWIDPAGKMVDRDDTYIQILSEGALDSEETGRVGENKDWIVLNSDEEEIELYYTKPLESGQVSDSFFMDEIGISELANNDYADLGIQLDLETDGVQIFEAEDAMLSEWGVLPAFGADGEILSIEE